MVAEEVVDGAAHRRRHLPAGAPAAWPRRRFFPRIVVYYFKRNNHVAELNRRVDTASDAGHRDHRWGVILPESVEGDDRGERSPVQSAGGYDPQFPAVSFDGGFFEARAVVQFSYLVRGGEGQNSATALVSSVSTVITTRSHRSVAPVHGAGQRHPGPVRWHT